MGADVLMLNGLLNGVESDRFKLRYPGYIKKTKVIFVSF